VHRDKKHDEISLCAEKKCLIFDILPPVCLDSKKFFIELSLNHRLKIIKFLKDFRFVVKQVNPYKFTEIIDEANIIIVFADKSGRRPPYIRENKFKRTRGYASGPSIG
jgi:hypothetical protein